MIYDADGKPVGCEGIANDLGFALKLLRDQIPRILAPNGNYALYEIERQEIEELERLL